MNLIQNDVNLENFLLETKIKHIFSVWPRRCRITNKLLWFTWCWRATISYPIFFADWYTEYMFFDEKCFLLLRIKYGI